MDSRTSCLGRMALTPSGLVAMTSTITSHPTTVHRLCLRFLGRAEPDPDIDVEAGLIEGMTAGCVYGGK